MTISQKFEEIENMAKPLMKLLEDRGKWASHRQEIIDRFRLLKDHLKRLYNSYRSINETTSFTENERHFVNDAYPVINTRVGDPPSDKMFSDVYDILDYLSYWKDDE